MRRSKVCRPRPPASRSANRCRIALRTGIVIGDRLADDQRPRIFQGLADAFAARHLAHAGMAGTVFQDDDIAGEERAMRAAEIEQHAVVARDRDHEHLRDHRRAHRRNRDFTLFEQLLLRPPIHLRQTIALVGGDLPGLDHRFPTSNLVRKEFGELLAVVGDHVETDRLELRLDVGRGGRCREFGLELRLDRSGQSLRRGGGLPGVDLQILTPASAIVGTSGSIGTRLSLVTASAFRRPAFTCSAIAPRF